MFRLLIAVSGANRSLSLIPARTVEVSLEFLNLITHRALMASFLEHAKRCHRSSELGTPPLLSPVRSSYKAAGNEPTGNGNPPQPDQQRRGGRGRPARLQLKDQVTNCRVTESMEPATAATCKTRYLLRVGRVVLCSGSVQN